MYELQIHICPIALRPSKEELSKSTNISTPHTKNSLTRDTCTQDIKISCSKTQSLMPFHRSNESVKSLYEMEVTGPRRIKSAVKKVRRTFGGLSEKSPGWRELTVKVKWTLGAVEDPLDWIGSRTGFVVKIWKWKYNDSVLLNIWMNCVCESVEGLSSYVYFRTKI